MENKFKTTTDVASQQYKTAGTVNKDRDALPLLLVEQLRSAASWMMFYSITLFIMAGIQGYLFFLQASVRSPRSGVTPLATLLSLLVILFFVLTGVFLIKHVNGVRRWQRESNQIYFDRAMDHYQTAWLWIGFSAILYIIMGAIMVLEILS